MTGRRCILALVSAMVLALAPACSSSSGADTRLRVVTSTDVYGDIVHAVTGNRADVVSVIDDPDQDPHSYEATTRNQLAISKAAVIVENGGGYDDFIDRMRSASGRSTAVLINVLKLSGKTAPAGGELNEHVWYDLPSVETLVTRLVTVLGDKDPGGRASFRANAARFDRQLHALEKSENAIRASYAGDGVAITEPVPLYLLGACGLVNKTPPAFSEAVEAGTDVSAAVLKQTLDLFSSKSVRALVYNGQTSGPETAKVLAAAKANGVAAVPVTETLPTGLDYLTWMRSNLGAVRSALAP